MQKKHSTQRFYKASIDCNSCCLNYLLPEQRDFVTKLRRANKYEPLELELNDSETPVSRTVYLISVANN